MLSLITYTVENETHNYTFNYTIELQKTTNTDYTICGNNWNACVSATMTYQLCPMEIDDQSVSLSKGDFQNILTVELL